MKILTKKRSTLFRDVQTIKQACHPELVEGHNPQQITQNRQQPIAFTQARSLSVVEIKDSQQITT